MLYTVLGFIAGCSLGHFVAVSTGNSPKRSDFVPPLEHFLFVVTFGMFGAGVGFYYGVSSLTNGTHIVQRMLK